MDLTAQYRRHPMVTPLYDRLDAAEDRLGRIENALSAILNHLNLPKLSTFSPESPKISTPSTSTSTPPSVPPKKDPYSYRSLDESQDEIRLLVVDNTTIQQGQDDKPITAELIHVSLNWKTGVIHHPAFGETKDIIPQYTAMSYTWGEPRFTASIVLNGHIFPVTRNVETALRHMCKAKPGRKSCWWVDQICINQSSLPERSSQVNLMRRIYKSASGVNVWLGEASPSSDKAMAMLSEMGTVIHRGPGQKVPNYEISSPEQIRENWSAIAEFFSRAWWSRGWIRQEVSLNHYTTVYCGTKSCEIGALTRVAGGLASLDEGYGVVPVVTDGSGGGGHHPFYRQAKMIGDIMSRTFTGYQFAELKECLFLSRAAEVTDLRDKVFSILGLADGEVHGLVADYGVGVREVLVAVAKSVLPTLGGLDLLAACQNPGREHGLPSWVPNLCDPWRAQPVDVEKMKNKSFSLPEVEFVEDLVMRVKGEELDTVGWICEEVVGSGCTVEELEGVYAIWKGFVSSCESEASGWTRDRKKYIASLMDPDTMDATWAHVLCMGDEIAPAMVSMLKNAGPGMAATMIKGWPFNYDLVRARLLEKDVLDGKEMRPESYVYGVMRKYGVGRRLCVTGRGYVGMVPGDARVGDSVMLFYGGALPFVLREEGAVEERKRYFLVGEAFFPGVDPLVTKPERYIDIV